MSDFTDTLKLGKLDYWYLATPYSKYPLGRDAAFRDASRYAGRLLIAGVNVFSPIAHSHPISKYTPIDPLAHDIWLPADWPLLSGAHGVLVLMLPSWDTSYGIKQEIEYATENNKPVIYVNPEQLL